MIDLIFAGAASTLAFTPCAPAAAGVAHSMLQVAEAPLSETEMSKALGGEGSAIDISNLGINIATTNGTVSNVSVSGGSDTGAIANNLVNGNSGITAVFNNTGNGVIFQNTVQVNVFLDGPR